MLEESHFYFQKAAELLGLSSKVRDILLTPFRVVKVEIVTDGDDRLASGKCERSAWRVVERPLQCM